MSDKAATENEFNEILKDYRNEVLPEVIKNFEKLNEESKAVISHMNNFSRGLHSLVHMAETAEKTLFEVEQSHFNGEIPIANKSFARTGKPGTIRLLFTACKAFARRGDHKSDCHGTFSTFVKTFLQEHGFLSLSLQL